MRGVLTYAAYLGHEFRLDVLEDIIISEQKAASPTLFRLLADEDIFGPLFN